MKKLRNPIIITAMVVLLAACASVQDVRRATDLIRADNELTRLLVEVRPGDQAGATAYLIGLASESAQQGDTLAAAQGNQADAIAFYRIAATAYWKSCSSETAASLFQTAEKGTALCTGMGTQAPDRDCLFLRLVIPFAGLEAVAGEELEMMMDEVDFNDGTATDLEKEMMEETYSRLKLARTPAQKILAVGSDDRLLSHASMRDYYCRNAKMAKEYYDSTLAVFIAKVREYGDNFGDSQPALGVDLTEARALKLAEKVPAFCSE
jgi:hypothetical protein